MNSTNKRQSRDEGRPLHQRKSDTPDMIRMAEADEKIDAPHNRATGRRNVGFRASGVDKRNC
jgi:hypothetical protein